MIEPYNTHITNQWNQALAFGCFLLSVGLGGFLYFRNLSYFNPCDFGPLFGMASIVILFGMFGLYTYAYVFYEDYFYQFLSMAWLLNAIYIFFETFFKPDQQDLNYNLTVYALGLLTLVPLHFASLKPPGKPIAYRELASSMLKWTAWLAGSFLVCYWLITVPLVNAERDAKFLVLITGGIPYAMWVLFGVGKNLRRRLDAERHGKWAWIFPLTFYVYAGLQPLYLLKLMLGRSGTMKYVFLAALLPKIGNSIAALVVIRLDTQEVQHLLEQRSVLEDLGALTASIEHDIKNPLQVIEAEIITMKGRFQSNPEISSFLERLEEQKRRIYATTQIIPVIRGGKEYYERFMEKTNLKDLANRSVKAVKKEMNTTNILFKVEERDLFVKSYRPMLEQALVNVLRNAVEAIHEAHRERGLINISMKILDEKEKNNTIRIDVEDNGSGIPPELLPNITKLFMTTRSKSKPNSGIGLFITKRILRVHGGKLDIKNNKGEGVTVSLFLPQWDRQM